MQTVYLRKGCPKSFEALIKLYTKPDMSTCIIVVNKFQEKILLLDKRVKTFPFIINTLPSNIGLIPKVARVMPLEYFMRLKKTLPKKQKIPNRYVSDQDKYKDKDKGFTLKVNTSQLVKAPVNNYKMSQFPKQFPKKQVNSFYKTHKKLLIKKQVQSDGGVSITLQ